MKNTTTTTGSGNANHTVTYVPRSDSIPGGNATDARPLIAPHHPLKGKHPLNEYLGEGLGEGIE